MKILSGMLGTVAVMALLAGPASAQGGPAKYGEPDKDKVADRKSGREGCRTGLSAVAGQHTGAEEPGPLGDRARQRACERSQGLAGEAEGQE